MQPVAVSTSATYYTLLPTLLAVLHMTFAIFQLNFYSRRVLECFYPRHYKDRYVSKLPGIWGTPSVYL